MRSTDMYARAGVHVQGGLAPTLDQCPHPPTDSNVSLGCRHQEQMQESWLPLLTKFKSDVGRNWHPQNLLRGDRSEWQEIHLRRPWWEGSEGRHWRGPGLAVISTGGHWEVHCNSPELQRGKGLVAGGVSYRSLLQEAVIEIEEGLLSFFGAQGAQHVRMQAAELGTHGV